MQLRNVVNCHHVKEAARFIRAATYQTLTDPYTGRIDFDQLHAGASEAARTGQTYLGEATLTAIRDNEHGNDRAELQEHVDKIVVGIPYPELIV